MTIHRSTSYIPGLVILSLYIYMYSNNTYGTTVHTTCASLRACVESARAAATTGTRNLSCENLLCWRYTIEDGYSSVHGGMLARTKQQDGPPATQYSTTTSRGGSAAEVCCRFFLCRLRRMHAVNGTAAFAQHKQNRWRNLNESCIDFESYPGTCHFLIRRVRQEMNGLDRRKLVYSTYYCTSRVPDYQVHFFCTVPTRRAVVVGQISSKSDAICEKKFFGEASHRDSLLQKADEPSSLLGMQTFKACSRSTAAAIRVNLFGLRGLTLLLLERSVECGSGAGGVQSKCDFCADQ